MSSDTLGKFFNFPNEIKEKIYYYFLDFYRFSETNWDKIHQELTNKEQYLIMTEHLFNFEVDYHYITRIPALESCSSLSEDREYWYSDSDVEDID